MKRKQIQYNKTFLVYKYCLHVFTVSQCYPEKKHLWLHLTLLLLGRIAVLRTQMQPTVTDTVMWSVCLSVSHGRELCKNG